jgi:hypothetical protein
MPVAHYRQVLLGGPQVLPYGEHLHRLCSRRIATASSMDLEDDDIDRHERDGDYRKPRRGMLSLRGNMGPA